MKIQLLFSFFQIKGRGDVFSLGLLSLAVFSSLACQQSLYEAKESAGTWQLLFDGKSLKGWRNYGTPGEKIRKGWSVKDGMLHLQAGKVEGYSKDAYAGGDLVTVGVYRDFDLRLQWKISPKGNSGIFVRVNEAAGNKPWMSAMEMQVFDNQSVKSKKGSTIAGAIYGLVSVDAGVARAVEEWQDVRIVVIGTHYRYWLNNVKVADFDTASETWKNKVKKSKFKDRPLFGQASKGVICLQDHTDEVSFRNIRIKEL